MPRRLLPLLLLSAGCVPGGRLPLVSSTTLQVEGPAPVERYVSKAPATEETAKRVIAVGQKVISANLNSGLRPLFITVGSKDPEIFHRGGKTDGLQVIVSEGLVQGCTSDDQLAAVLCMELGKVAATRGDLPGVPGKDERPFPGETIGAEVGGAFGSSDGTRMMELAKQEKERQAGRRAPPASPEKLARGFLVKAGYPGEALDQVETLLRMADRHDKIEKAMLAAPTR